MRSVSTKVAGVIALSLLLAVAAAPAALAAKHRINAKSTADGWAYTPQLTHASKGDKAVFRNRDAIDHKVRLWKGPKGINWDFRLAPGTKKTKALKKKGLYRYRCNLQGHSYLEAGKCYGMCGRIRVH